MFILVANARTSTIKCQGLRMWPRTPNPKVYQIFKNSDSNCLLKNGLLATVEPLYDGHTIRRTPPRRTLSAVPARMMQPL